jgi:hypothetical protein
MDSCGHCQLEPCFQSGLRIVSISATNQSCKGLAGFENLSRRILRQPGTSDYETVVSLVGGCRREDRWKLRLSLFPFFREAGLRQFVRLCPRNFGIRSRIDRCRLPIVHGREGERELGSLFDPIVGIRCHTRRI